MSKPRLECRWWGDVRWPRLARALSYSARKHNPDWDINVLRIKPALPPSPLGVQSHSDNTAKMTVWKGIIDESQDGDRVLLIDADTMVLRSMTDVWDQDFDMGYTNKPLARFPFNSGVVFLRVGPKTRRFMEAWEAENIRLLNSPKEHQKWRARYGGVNQAALGAMLENRIVSDMKMKIAALPCRDWNNEDSSWKDFVAANPRIVHLKSGLRHSVFSRPGQEQAVTDEIATTLRPIVETWQAIDREAAEAELKARHYDAERTATA